MADIVQRNVDGDAAIAAALEASTVAIRAAHIAAEAVAAARVKTWLQMSAQIAIWVVLVLLAYGTVNTRLQVLEVKYDRIASDISEIRADVKSVLRQQQQQKP